LYNNIVLFDGIHKLVFDIVILFVLTCKKQSNGCIVQTSIKKISCYICYKPLSKYI